MSRLAVLEEPRTFPPNRLLFVVWGVTLLISLFGLFAVSNTPRSFLFWIVIAAVAFWQVWVTRWVRVDQEGIKIRNIFQRGRQLRWEEITEFREEELPLQKRSYVTIHLSNHGAGTPHATKINVTSDQVGFESLRTIVREAVPKPPQTDEPAQT
jgi:hypothetical protein